MSTSHPVSLPGDDHARGWSIASVAGSIAAAFLASACCVGPLLLALLGLGGGALLVKLAPYRPFFLLLTAGVLAAGFYLTYRTPRAARVSSSAKAVSGTGGEACGCPAPRARRTGKILLWIATAIVALLVVFPYLTPLFIRS